MEGSMILCVSQGLAWSIPLLVHNKVISKVGRLGRENAEFQHNKALNA